MQSCFHEETASSTTDGAGTSSKTGAAPQPESEPKSHLESDPESDPQPDQESAPASQSTVSKVVGSLIQGIGNLFFSHPPTVVVGSQDWQTTSKDKGANLDHIITHKYAS